MQNIAYKQRLGIKTTITLNIKKIFSNEHSIVTVKYTQKPKSLFLFCDKN